MTTIGWIVGGVGGAALVGILTFAAVIAFRAERHARHVTELAVRRAAEK
jgi:hypothetical protein